MSGIWLPLAAVTISIFLVIIFFTKKSIKTKEVQLYKYTLVINAIFSINAALAYVIAELTNQVWLVSLLQRIHFGLLLTIGCCLVIYNIIINQLEEEKYEKIKKLLIIINTILVILVFISPITTIIDGEILDVKGLSYNIMMIPAISGCPYCTPFPIRIQDNFTYICNLPNLQAGAYSFLYAEVSSERRKSGVFPGLLLCFFYLLWYIGSKPS